MNPPTFEVVHPRHPEVIFIFRGLLPHEGLSLYPLTQSEHTGSYLVESFTIACLNWFNITSNGENLACTEENKRIFASIPQNNHLISYLMRRAEELSHEYEREDSENLQKYLNFETGDTKYTEGSEEHQIDAGDPFHRNWCCKLEPENNVWELYGQTPPCHICPRRDFQLSTRNTFAMSRWNALDFVGRSRGMTEEPLRIESICDSLKYYGCGPESLMGSIMLEKIIKIESALFGYRLKKKAAAEKKQKMSENKANSQLTQRAGR